MILTLGPAGAACFSSPNGQLLCNTTTTTDSSNVNAAAALSVSREQIFTNGKSLTATIPGAQTIDGSGLYLEVSGDTSHGPVLALTNAGQITSNAFPDGALVLSNKHGSVGYAGPGAVSSSDGVALFVRAGGDIAMTIDGAVTAGSPAATPHRLPPTPPAVHVIEHGTGSVHIDGLGTILAPAGRGLWVEEDHRSFGNIVIEGSGTISSQGLICPSVSDFQKSLAKGKTGCSGIRAVIENPASHGNVSITRSGNISATSAGINAITSGEGDLSITIAPQIHVVGAYEFGIEASAKGHYSHGNIRVTTGTGSIVSSGGDGIYAVNSSAVLPKRYGSLIDVSVYGTIVSGSFAPASQNEKNPEHVTAGILAGYLGSTDRGADADIYGTLRVSNFGSVDASSGDGILAIHNGSGASLVVDDGRITAQAGNGIQTLSGKSSTQISLGPHAVVEGTGVGNAAVFAISKKGPIAIDIAAGASVSGFSMASGLRASAPLVSLHNEGTLTGSRTLQQGNADDRGAALVGSNMSVVNTGSLTSGTAGAQGYAAIFTGGDNTLVNAGAITGGIFVKRGAWFRPGMEGVLYPPLAFDGSLMLAPSSTLKIAMTPTASEAVSAARAVSIGGANLFVMIRSPPKKGTIYTILTGGQGVTGTFGSVATSLAFVSPVLDYSAKSVRLAIVYNYRLPEVVANVAAVGAALNRAANLPKTQGGQQIFATLKQVPAASGTAILNSLSGEGLLGFQAMAFGAISIVDAVLVDELVDGAARGQEAVGAFEASYPSGAATPRELGDNVGTPAVSSPVKLAGWRAWTSLLGGMGHVSGDANLGAAGQQTGFGGALVGIDHQLTSSSRLGVVLGGTNGSASVPDRTTSERSSGGFGGLYGIAVAGGVYGAASLVAADFDTNTRRVASAGPGFVDTERANFGSSLIDAHVEFGRPVLLASSILTPYVALEFASIQSSPFTEASTSAGQGLALNVDHSRDERVRSALGVRYTWSDDVGGILFIPHVRVAWLHDWLPTRPSVSAGFVNLPTTSWLVQTASLKVDAADYAFGTDLLVGSATRLFANVEGQTSRDQSFFGGSVGLRWVW